MNILSFVDMHGSHKALEEIKKKAKNADIIVCAGDISIFENNLDKLFFELNKPNKPLLIIPGNHESTEDIEHLSKFFENIFNIDRKGFIKENCLFIGYGGGGFSMVDKEFERLGERLEKEVKKHKGKKIILITHSPPYKTRIDKIMEEHCGNKAIKHFILKAKPDLVISGHLHENDGKEDRIGKTLIINPGPFGKIIKI